MHPYLVLMRFVTDTSLCTSDSLEDLADAIVSERIKGGLRKTELSSQAREALRLAYYYSYLQLLR
jgi:hypothetical protein